jgi:hypothetical protein
MDFYSYLFLDSLLNFLLILILISYLYLRFFPNYILKKSTSNTPIHNTSPNATISLVPDLFPIPLSDFNNILTLLKTSDDEGFGYLKLVPSYLHLHFKHFLGSHPSVYKFLSHCSSYLDEDFSDSCWPSILDDYYVMCMISHPSIESPEGTIIISRVSRDRLFVFGNNPMTVSHLLSQLGSDYNHYCFR